MTHHLTPHPSPTPSPQRIIDEVRRTHPDLPIILYISGSGGLIERMAQCGPDVLSIDHSVDLGDAIRRGGSRFAYQGNLDPAILFAEKVREYQGWGW